MNLKISNMNKKQIVILILFIFSTSYFIYQHYIDFPWDFSVHVLNAKYWFSNEDYFESYRPPLMTFIIGFFSIFGWKVSEYLFIIFSNALFTFSTLRLAKKLNIDELIYYFFCISPFFLFYGILGGTELLALSFLQLALSEFFVKRTYGQYLGLAFLARYPSLIFLFLFALYRKNFMKNILSFIAVMTPWFIYNKLKLGHSFSSIINSYSLNYLFQTSSGKIEIIDILFVFSFFLPFFIFGFFKSIRFIIYKNKDKILVNAVFLAITAVIIYQILTIPMKDLRYWYLIVIPIAYYSAYSINETKIKKKHIFVLVSVFVLNIIFLCLIHGNYHFTDREKYNDAANKIVQLNISSCRLESDHWPLLNYIGINVEPVGWDLYSEHTLSNGTYQILFNRIARSDFIIYESEEYRIYGNLSLCLPQREINFSYLEFRKENLKYYGLDMDNTNCNVITKNDIMRTLCSLF